MDTKSERYSAIMELRKIQTDYYSGSPEHEAISQAIKDIQRMIRLQDKVEKL